VDRFDKLKQLIESSSEVVEFADFGHGISDEWIQRAEAALAVEFPPTYRWWLRNYGGGEVGGEEIYSVYGENFDTVVGGDVVYMNRTKQANGLLTQSQLAICHSDVDGLFYFDVSLRDDNRECPIRSAATARVYAQDFIEFLEKRIRAHCR